MVGMTEDRVGYESQCALYRASLSTRSTDLLYPFGLAIQYLERQLLGAIGTEVSSVFSR